MKIAQETFTSANILDGEVGTTGPMGGDAGHGYVTVLDTLDMVHGLREAQKRPQALDAPLWPWTRTHAWQLVRGVMQAVTIPLALARGATRLKLSLRRLCKSLVVISARSAIFGLSRTSHGSRWAGWGLVWVSC